MAKLAKEVLGKSAVDAFNEAKSKLNQKQSETAAQTMSRAEAWKLATKEIEEESKGFDFTLMPENHTKFLSDMPLTTTEEILKWRDMWVKYLRKYNFNRNTKTDG